VSRELTINTQNRPLCHERQCRWFYVAVYQIVELRNEIEAFYRLRIYVGALDPVTEEFLIVAKNGRRLSIP